MSTISLSTAMSEPAPKQTPKETVKEDQLIRAIGQVMLHERLQVAILIPGVESIGPGRKITPQLVKVMARKGFAIDDKKLNDTVAARIEGSLNTPHPAPLRTAALTGEKKPLPQNWKDLEGGLPALETLAQTHDLRSASGRPGGLAR